jgi:hypothetical protein
LSGHQRLTCPFIKTARAEKKGVRTIKNSHETHSTEKFHKTDNDEIFSPTEDLQKIVAGGVFKRNSFNLNIFPKWIKYLGYFIVGFIVAISLIVLMLNLLF